MKYYVDETKAAILSGEVFDGLAVDDLQRFIALFMKPEYALVVFSDDVENTAYMIYEVIGDTFKFHVVNFTKMQTKAATEIVIAHVVVPFCKEHNIKYIEASVERVGMAKKLEHLGFKCVENNIYKGEVTNVLK